ncbi:uncharacterized LOC100279158 [Zea mays]|uniref:Pentatricopeptide repeat-containing protein n=1 Tax=Zea mays TaxID=4577 RepID=B6UIF7_MAIZE|nr:uncharacterized LOC100279158 [Zea mays]ACG49140.1 hypothetical protein [Zea mays]|eukprot:NP_001145661.1 uncharacterized LOC100279158 [Zea mays]
MPSTDLRRLTARIVDLPPGSPRSWRTWKQLRGGGFRNTIGMNVVLEACVRCGDVDRALRLFEEIRGPRGCGVDGVLRHPAQGMRLWYLFMHATLTHAIAKTHLVNCLF